LNCGDGAAVAELRAKQSPNAPAVRKCLDIISLLLL
jgi:hypothetical protein